MGAKSPLLWDKGQVDSLLAGSPVVNMVKERLKVLPFLPCGFSALLPLLHFSLDALSAFLTLLPVYFAALSACKTGHGLKSQDLTFVRLHKMHTSAYMCL